MNFDDQDWDLEEGATRPALASTGVWKVAAGVAVGIVIGGALVGALDLRPPGQDAKPAAMATATVTEAKPAAAETPVSEPAPAVVRAPVAAPREADAPGAQALRAAQHAAERKERAWAMFYRKPAACDDSPPKASLVECANHFIRAKREFEQLYENGKPAPGRPNGSASRAASAP